MDGFRIAARLRVPRSAIGCGTLPADSVYTRPQVRHRQAARRTVLAGARTASAFVVVIHHQTSQQNLRLRPTIFTSLTSVPDRKLPPARK